MHDPQSLLELASVVRQKAYAPYSQFLVGAAVETTSGEVFTGCNVENASYGLAICAERHAIGNAVQAGFQSFSQIAVVASRLATPCGACRQFIFEFGSEIRVLCAAAESLDAVQQWTISELLPHGFRFDQK